ncbi:DUF2897 family protein [Rheinheimera gaetbuli]
MNWPLFWALTLAFGVVISNILLLKHAVKFTMPTLKPRQNEQPRQTKPATQSQHVKSDQKPNSLE